MTLRLSLLVLALAASSPVWSATPDGPARAARLSYVEGPMTFQGADTPPTSTLPDRPLAPGDRIHTERGGRAELALGTAAIRLDEQSALGVVALDPTTVRVELAAGTASVNLRELFEDETFEIATPNTTIALDAPGDYRVDVDESDTTALTVHGGAATAQTAGGPVRAADGQRVRLEGRDALARLETPRPADAFDDWVLEREVRLAEAEPPRYTPYEGEEAEYDELDRYGEWYDEPRYGRVWMPSYAYGGWSPFRHGHWVRVGYGWSWFDPLPWSSFTFHRGRWAFLNHLNRWCWVPGPRFHGRHFDRGRHFDHGRHVARDTRPFGHPRRDERSRDERDDPPRDVRSRDDGEDVLRRVLWRSDPKGEQRPAATGEDRPRGATAVRSLDDRSRAPTWRPSSPSRGSVTTTRPSSGSATSTMAPSRSSASAPSRSSSSSRTASRDGQRTERSSSSSTSSKSTFAVRPH